MGNIKSVHELSSAVSSFSLQIDLSAWVTAQIYYQETVIIGL